MLAKYHLNLTTFYGWNPTVKEDCTGLAVGTYYCVSTYPGGVPPSYPYEESDDDTASSTTATSTALGTGDSVTTPSPVQTGMISNCDEFHQVLSGDTCYGIAMNYAISLSGFYSWNPAVGSDCQYLITDDYVCVGVLESSSAGTTTTISHSTSVSTPSSVQTGMVSSCDEFHQVVSGDTCYDIAMEYDISLSDCYS